MVECEDDQLQDVCHDPMIVQVALMTGPVYQPLRQPNTDTTHITEEESFLILTSMPGLNGQSVSLGVKYYTVLQYYSISVTNFYILSHAWAGSSLLPSSL